jgi:Domain of unknown function (DUF6484)
MRSGNVVESEIELVNEMEFGNDLLHLLKKGNPPNSPQPTRHTGVLIGELIGIANEGRTPLVLFPGQTGSAAIVARSTIDLHGPHIGRKVVLMFEGGDTMKPIVMGVLRDGDEGWPIEEKPGQVQVDADGQRLIVSAKEQMVLQCGKASITLTKAGKVLIQGSYLLSRSSGVNRIKGGSVQLN